jgi:O-antigen ligase
MYLKEKATSIVTSFYTEDEKGSTGSRVELWKGALLIFKESPLMGVGTGNFESSIKRLVHEKKLKKTPTLVHAHNIFLQALATRGVFGIITTLGLFIALIKWGTEEIRNHGSVGGYIIILSTAFTMISGLTENNIEFTRFLAAYCFTIGLFGSLESLKKIL